MIQHEQKEIMLYFFLGYLPTNCDKMVGLHPIKMWKGDDGMKEAYWSKYWTMSTPPTGQVRCTAYEHKVALFKQYTEPCNTVAQFFNVHAPRANDANQSLRRDLKDTLRNICVEYWRKYYNKGPRAKWPKREYPEFEYWLWAVLETLTGNIQEGHATVTLLKYFDIRRFYNEEEKNKHKKGSSNSIKKPLGLETVKSKFINGSPKTIKSNIEHVLKFYCDKNFKPPTPKTYKYQNWIQSLLSLSLNSIHTLSCLYIYCSIILELYMCQRDLHVSRLYNESFSYSGVPI